MNPSICLRHVTLEPELRLNMAHRYNAPPDNSSVPNMDLLRLDKISLQYGTQVLLDDVDLQIDSGQRLGILGRNGEGKSSLVKVLAGDLAVDSGERWLRPGTRLATLAQDLPDELQSSVFDFVAGGLAEAGVLLRRYAALTAAGGTDLAELERVQHALEAVDGWSLDQQVRSTLSQLELDGNAALADLSGGWRRRAALARALVGKPDILFLDEPTNHLDIPAIEWLQKHLQNLNCALVLITHDRRFLQEMVNHIAELDRGSLTVWRGDYRGYLRHREERLAAEERANALFDKKLSEEERWIRQGIKARRTRNEGRVRALKAMRDERQARRERSGTASLLLSAAGESGKLVAELEQVNVTLGDKQVIRDFSFILQRGDRVGIVGPNGAGKTTLIRLLTGELAADAGRIRLGSRLEIAYADQLRSALDPSKDLIDNVCGGREFIDLNGKPRHAVSYLGDFLFSPQRLRTPVGALSGGEQNRAVLAKLFSKPMNLMVLDEPTNDLDIETLELLEERLLEFQGTVLLVSHDRAFMDNVVTSLLVLKGDGSVDEQAGGFSDWESRGGRLQPLSSAADSETGGIQAHTAELTALEAETTPEPSEKTAASKKPEKLSYREQRELEALPGEIEDLEERKTELETLSADAGFYAGDPDDVRRQLQELTDLGSLLEAKIERWAELEERS